MKNIFTTLVFIAATFTLSAQGNLGITFANYTNGQVFSNDTIKTAFVIKNHGGAMYHTGDTLYVNARINGTLRSLDLFGTNATPIILTKMLHGGDTLQYNPGNLSGSQTLPFFPGATTLDVCMIIWGRGIASVSPTYGGDTDTTNNTTCATYDPSFTSIQHVSAAEIGLHVYPNPATNVVQFSTVAFNDVKELLFTDLNGRVIEAFNKLQSSTTAFSTGSWSNGIYFYQVRMNDGKVSTGKFAVTH